MAYEKQETEMFTLVVDLSMRRCDMLALRRRPAHFVT